MAANELSILVKAVLDESKSTVLPQIKALQDQINKAGGFTIKPTINGKQIGSAIGTGTITALSNAMTSYANSKSAKDSGEAIGSAVSNGISGAMSGAMIGASFGGVGALIGGALGAIASGVSSAVGYSAGEMQRAIDKANELTLTLQEQSSTINNNLSTLKGLREEFSQLSKGVDDYGANISLSADEYRRYKDIVGQILGLSPELITGYDSEGNAIANKNGLLERSIELQKIENENRLSQMGSLESTKTIIEGLTAAQQKYNEELYRTNSFAPKGYGDQIKDLLSVDAASLTLGVGQSGGVKDLIEGVLGADAFTRTATGYRVYSYLITDVQAVVDNIDAIVAAGNARILAGQKGLTEEELLNLQSLVENYKYVDQEKNRILQQGVQTQAQIIAQQADGYDELTNESKDFLNEWLKDLPLPTDGNALELPNNIQKFTASLADSQDTQDLINKFFEIDKTQVDKIACCRSNAA